MNCYKHTFSLKANVIYKNALCVQSHKKFRKSRLFIFSHFLKIILGLCTTTQNVCSRITNAMQNTLFAVVPIFCTTSINWNNYQASNFELLYKTVGFTRSFQNFFDIKNGFKVPNDISYICFYFIDKFSLHLHSHPN